MIPNLKSKAKTFERTKITFRSRGCAVVEMAKLYCWPRLMSSKRYKIWVNTGFTYINKLYNVGKGKAAVNTVC